MLWAQVGVNTENINNYLFYLDGASTTATKNPTSGVISAQQMSDDVMINKLGNIGVGTPPTNAKLTVKAENIGDAFKMADTSEGLYKALVSSNTNGLSAWSSIAGAWFGYMGRNPLINDINSNVVRKLTNYEQSTISESGFGSIDPLAGNITVPITGAYRCTIFGWMGWGRTSGINSDDPYINVLCIYVNGVRRTDFTAISLKRWGMNQNFFAIIDLNAGDVVSVYKDESTPNHGTNTGRMSILLEYLY